MKHITLSASTLLQSLFLFIAGVYFFVALIMGVAYFLARFTKVEPRTVKPKFLKRINKTEDWAEEHGMTFAGFFAAPSPYAVWYLADRSLFLFQIMLFWKRKFVLVTRFPDDVLLLTANIIDDTGNCGPPGRYIQTFPRSTLDELWNRHCEAERYLVEQCGVVFTPRLPDVDWPEEDDINSRRMTDSPLHTEMIDRAKDNPFAVLYDDDERANPQRDSDSLSQSGVRFVQQNLQRNSRAVYRYMFGLFQWRWLLWWYWVFIRYWFIRNLTVEQLIAKGWYKHPQNLPPNYRKWYK